LSRFRPGFGIAFRLFVNALLLELLNHADGLADALLGKENLCLFDSIGQQAAGKAVDAI